MTDPLKSIEDTARAATQGEWKLMPRAAATVCYEQRNIANCAGYSDNMDRDKSDAENDANAAHIALMSPQRTLELVAHIHALSGTIALCSMLLENGRNEEALKFMTSAWGKDQAFREGK